MYFLVEIPKCVFLIEAHFSRHLNEGSELIPCDMSFTCYMYQYHVGKVCVYVSFIQSIGINY